MEICSLVKFTTVEVGLKLMLSGLVILVGFALNVSVSLKCAEMSRIATFNINKYFPARHNNLFVVMKYIIVSFIFIYVNFGCSNESNNSSMGLDDCEMDSVRTIKISLTDTSWTDVKSLLEMDSYIILSSVIPLGNLKRVVIEKDHIYILDKHSKLVCFKPNGNIAFSLNKKGKGQGEYIDITDMIINPEMNILTVADQGRRKLIHYSSKNGSFLMEEDLKVSAKAMAFYDGVYYYYNPFHHNYTDNEMMHFSLLSSNDGVEVNKGYLKHDPLIANYMFDDNFRQFSYNKDEVYFRKRFIDTVFAINSHGLVPRYSIELPDPLPYSLIQQRPDMLELFAKSKYSSTLHGIYKSGNILHFNFFKEQFVASTFYDLEKDETIYCGNHIYPYPTKQLPVYSLIDGVYKGKFFSLVSAMTVLEDMERNPAAFSKDWSKINENSNPVLVFYNLVN